MSEKPLIELVLECINVVVSSYGSSKEVVKKIRTRARSIPEEAFIKGLVYALTFTASKSGKSVIEIGLKATKCEDIINTIKDIVNKSTDSKPSEEELSYGIYGAILLYIAKSVGIIKGDKFEQVIHEMLEKPAVVELKMWNVLDWLKRIAEAYIHE